MQSHERRVFNFEGQRAIAIHLTARLRDDSGIARDASSLREASRTLKEHGDERGLLAHRIADNHLHSILACSREDAGMFARYALSGLRKRLALPDRFEPARLRPIGSERYLLNSVRYLFTQEAHHGTAFDLVHDGSSLPELLGMRVDPSGTTKRLRRLLPRVSRDIARPWLGVGEFESADPDLDQLQEATASAFGIDYTGSDEPAQRSMRRAAAHLAKRLVPEADVTELLGVTRRSLQRYLSERPGPGEVRAVELQLRLRSFLLRAASPERD